MADKLAETGTRVGEHGRTLREEAADIGGNRGMEADAIGNSRSTPAGYASQAKQYAQQGYRFAVDKSKKVKETTEDYIQENPWYAVGIALGVGILVGLLLRGRGGNTD